MTATRVHFQKESLVGAENFEASDVPEVDPPVVGEPAESHGVTA